MKLPFSLPLKREPKKEYFLSLLLKDDKIQAVIFEEFMGKMHLIGKHEEHLDDSIDHTDIETLLEKADKALSTAESTLPDDIQTQKTIFGVKADWVADAKIKKEHLAKLKKISDSLGLSPIGFLTISEAIIHLLAQEEGAPVSGILVEVGKTNITASLLRAGKIVESHTKKLEDSIAQTTDILLRHFSNYEVLPSRLIVSDGKGESLSQEFIGHTWSKSLAFLHVPQITTLPSGFDAKAMLFGAATQMGFDTPEPEKKTPAAPVENEKPALETDSSLAFGFVENEDVATLKAQEEDTKDVAPKESGEDAGEEDATIGEKIKEEKEGPVINDHGHKLADEEKEETEPEVELTPVEEPIRILQTTNEEKPIKKLNTSPLAALGAIFSRVKIKNPFGGVALPLVFSSFLKGNKLLLFIPPVILLVLIAGILSYIFLLKATVVVTLQPKAVEKNQTITFTTDSASDFENNIIAGKVVETAVEGSTATPATGTKSIGDKAKGSVTFYSRLPQQKTFSSGTTITDANGLAFTLDKDISLASSSGDASANPTTATVSVSAKDIGKESNLGSGAKFSVSGFNQSDIVAKNDSAFTGGSKKDITVIAKKDLDKLTADLPKKLEDKAKETLKQSSTTQVVLPIFINNTLSKSTFDGKLNDEASSVTLKGTVTYQSIAYDKSALEDLAKVSFKDELSTMTLAKEGFSYDVKDVVQNKKQATGKVTLKANVLPKLDPISLTKAIAGKSFSEADAFLLKQPQVADTKVSFTPPIPFLPEMLPKNEQNITVIIKQNE